ncbi:NOX5 [Bugula neritina]|uniref:NOX5 n=1 Tax=Bugula neritina TaxID=10212 RepID=A0A7J7KBC0_BUGNE|nr:NOX5 [Bugula neritina]
MEGSFMVNRKVDAVNSIYKRLKNSTYEKLTFQDLQNIFPLATDSESGKLFEYLLFQEKVDYLSKQELISALRLLTVDLQVSWPSSLPNQSEQRSQNGCSSTISSMIACRQRESLTSIADQVDQFIDLCSETSCDIMVAHFIQHISAQLLQVLYEYVTRNGAEKRQVLKRIRSLVDHYEEETEWWADIQRKCYTIIGNKPSITLSEFQQIFLLEEFLSNRIFSLADTNGDGEVDRRELFATMSTLVLGHSSQKLRFLFAIYDQNGDGKLERNELKHAFQKGLAHSKLGNDITNANLLTDVLFTKAKEGCHNNRLETDFSSPDSITFEELNALLQQNPMIYDNLNIQLTDGVKKGHIGSRSLDNLAQSVYHHVKVYTSLWLWVGVMSLITVALGVERLVCQLKLLSQRGCCVEIVVAKTCGQVLNFHYSLLLVFVLKTCITRLQRTFLRHYLPFDDALRLHKVTAITAFLVSVIHVIAHSVNLEILIYLLITANRTKEEEMSLKSYISSDFISSPILGSGVVLVILLFLYIVTGIEIFRIKFYSVFYISHKVLLLLWYITLLCHAKMFIYWLMFPGTLLVFEKIRTLYTMYQNRSVVELASTHDNVTILHIKRPDGFDYSPGDYVTVLIPKVSKYLWRPFTISSGNQDKITLHIRKAGFWTNKIYEKVHQLERTAQLGGRQNDSYTTHTAIELDLNENSLRRDKNTARTSSSMFSESNSTTLTLPASPHWRIYMDGPFSTPSHDILKTEHVILIAGGIGITPFASVISSVIEQLKQRSKMCPCGCETRVYFGNTSNVSLKRIDLFWLTRSVKSLQWFLGVFEELEEEQISLDLDPPLVNFHLHLTGLAKETDMRGAFLQLALNAAYNQERTDLLTGLKAQTKPGRPVWSKVIPELIDSAEPLKERTGTAGRPLKSKVYACGPVQLCKELKTLCSNLKLPFREEVFN